MASPAVAVRDELVLPSEQRMIWMPDPEGFTRPGGITVVDRVLQREKGARLPVVAADRRGVESVQ